MNSELIVMTFSHQSRAVQTRDALEAMRHRHYFGLDHAVLVIMGGEGQAAVDQQRKLPARPCSPGSCLSLLFAGAIFGRAAEKGPSDMIDMGLDAQFLKRVTSALASGGSALLIHVPHDSLVDTRRLLNTLELFRGTVHHTSFPVGLEETLVNRAWASAC